MNPTSITAVVALLAVLALPGSATAARIPVLYGDGETIAFVADLPANSPLIVGPNRWIGDRPTRLGYKYHRWHIFWIPIWTYTSGGEFVAYDEVGFLMTTYIPLGTDPAEVAAKSGVADWRVTIPSEAWHPWGLYLLVTILGIAGAAELRRWPAKAKVERKPTGESCFSCGVVTPLLSWELTPDGRRFIKARCPKCDVFLAIAPQTWENVEKANAAERPSGGVPWWIWPLLGGVLFPIAGTLLRPWSALLGITGLVLGLTGLGAGLYGLVSHCRPRKRLPL